MYYLLVSLICSIITCSGGESEPEEVNGYNFAMGQITPSSHLVVSNFQGLNNYRIAITGNSHMASLGNNVASLIVLLTSEKPVIAK